MNKAQKLVLNDIEYGETMYPIAMHDSQNLYAIQQTIADGGSLIVLGQSSLSTTMISAFVAGITLIEKMLDSGNKVGDILQKGDTVIYDGRRGIYIGKETFHGMEDEPKIKIQFNDGLILGISPKNAWKLSKCSDDVRRIDNYSSKKRSDLFTPRTLLSEILERSEEDIPPFLPARLVVVAQKNKALRHFTQLHYKGTTCTTILPTAYYVSLDSFQRLGHDPLTRDPIVCFTTSVELAARLLTEPGNRKGLIIQGCDQIRGNTPHIEKLHKEGIPVVVASEFYKADLGLINKLHTLEFDVVTQIPGDYDVAPANLPELSDVNSDPFLASPLKFNNASSYSMDVMLVTHELGNVLERISNQLTTHNRNQSFSEDLRQFLIKLWGIANRLARMPLTIQDCESIGYSYSSELERLSNGLPSLYSSLPRDIFSDIRSIQMELNECVMQHIYHHPKQQLFMEHLHEIGDRGCVLVYNHTDKGLLTRWLHLKGFDAAILTKHEIGRLETPFDICLTTGWYSDLHRLAYSGLVRYHFAILYPYERSLYETNIKHLANHLRRLVAGVSKPLKAPSEQSWFDFGSESELTIRAFASYLSSDEVSASQSSRVHALPVIFEEDFVAFLTRTHGCRCLDLDDEMISVKHPKDLQTGDILVFVKDSSSDIFDELVSIVKRADSEIRSIADIANIWKNALIRYVEYRDLTVLDLQKELQRLGVERETSTIRLWFSDERIGPGEDAIRTIARLTQDPDLNRKVDHVINACAQMRALHVKIGRYLARSIVSSITGRLVHKEDSLLSNLSDDLTRHAELVTVLRVDRQPVLISLSKANRLYETPLSDTG